VGDKRKRNISGKTLKRVVLYLSNSMVPGWVVKVMRRSSRIWMGFSGKNGGARWNGVPLPCVMQMRTIATIVDEL
jgi:hypothetical protein